jgi:Ca2+-binding RTX toxin-like protein
MPTWTLHHGGPTYSFIAAVSTPFFSGALTDADTSFFTRESGIYKVVAHGTFAVTGNVPTGGTVAGFDLYAGNVKIATMTGYAISIADFNAIVADCESASPQGLLGETLLAGELDITGSDEADVLYGGSEGGGAAWGGGGEDRFFGLSQDDFVNGGEGKDLLWGNMGRDTADYSEKDVGISVVLRNDAPIDPAKPVQPPMTKVLVGGVVEDKIHSFENINGGSAGDRITGNMVENTLHGNAGNDKLSGMQGDDALRGGLDNDRLAGGKGGDNLSGGAGKDFLKGGAGGDSFIFDAALGGDNIDRIADFVSGKELIVLKKSVFAGLDVGHLPTSAFHIGKQAADADDRIVYHKATGALFFDADGAGGVDQLQFAKLTPGTSLVADDLFVAFIL